MSASQKPFLDLLLSAYFHQDWGLSADTDADVVEEFVKCEGPEAKSQAAGELRRILASPYAEEYATRYLGDNGCAYAPAADGLTDAAWLKRILQLLESHHQEDRA